MISGLKTPETAAELAFDVLLEFNQRNPITTLGVITVGLVSGTPEVQQRARDIISKNIQIGGKTAVDYAEEADYTGVTSTLRAAGGKTSAELQIEAIKKELERKKLGAIATMKN